MQCNYSLLTAYQTSEACSLVFSLCLLGFWCVGFVGFGTQCWDCHVAQVCWVSRFGSSEVWLRGLALTGLGFRGLGF